MKENGIKKVFNFPVSRRVAKKIRRKGFVNIDNDEMGGSRLTYFY